MSTLHYLHADRVFVDGQWREGVAVALRADRLVAVVALGAMTPGAPVERLAGRALLPGFVNAHSHAFQRGLRGHVQFSKGPDSFWSWRDRMYELASSLSPEGVEAVSALAFLEMVAAGFTTVGEFHYLHHAPGGQSYADPDELAVRVLAAAEHVGIRIVLLRVGYGRAGFGAGPSPLQERFYDRDADAVLDATVRLRARGYAVGLAPHSMRACPAEWLRAFSAFDGPIHAHVDEQPAEIEVSIREHGVRPVHVFGDAGLLDDRFTAVHLTHPDRSELDRMRGSGARVCVCPTTELDLGDGFFPLEGAAGIPLCVGTDSHAQIDAFAEIRAIELHARAVTGRRNVMAHESVDGLAATLLAIGARGGAEALRVDAGRLEAGALADLIAVDLHEVALRGARLTPALVFAGHPGMVTDVWVGGRRVIEGRRHVHARAIVERAERVLQRAG